jgi:hypothetical protein
MPDAPAVPCWWTISEDALKAMLQRVADGADPEWVYLEEYANADIEHVPGEDED